MNFKIEKVQHDGDWVDLSDYRAHGNGDNLFTLIVGQNAVGKSRLLRKIVSNYVFSSSEKFYSETNDIFEEQHYKKDLFLSLTPEQIITRNRMFGRERDQEILCSPYSEIAPANIIAVSTGRHDRFPLPSRSRRQVPQLAYNYIGSDVRSGFNISSSLTSLLEGLVESTYKLDHLSTIFEYLGFEPYLDIKLALDKRNYSKSIKNKEYLYEHRIDPSIIEYLLSEDDQPIKSYRWPGHIYEELKHQAKSNIEVSFRDHYLEKEQSTLLDLIPLIHLELVKVTDVTLVSSKGKSKLRLSQASSGQQCMLTIMLGIAGTIRNGSLICIDEPEISLHPSWQLDIVSQLQNVFSGYYGCHFVIATHSPQIVSGLTTDNGYVLNLEDRELYYSHEYAKRSADFQLAEIFNSPGFNNEYLVRLTLLILTKISRRERLSAKDIENINLLKKTKKLLSEIDPVFHLIGQVEAIY